MEARPLPSVAVSSQPQPASQDRTGTPVRGKPAVSKDIEQPSGDLLAGLRSDLAATQKARTALQAQVDDLTASLSALQTENKASASQIAQLTRQKADVERKLRDRDEELRGKSRLVEQAQDEMVSLGLQLNMAEERKEKLTKENKELVDRWMARMGEEADRVNRDSRWT